MKCVGRALVEIQRSLVEIHQSFLNHQTGKQFVQKKKKKFKHPHVVTVVGLNLKSQSRLCKVTQVRTVIILTSQKEKSTSVINDMDMDIKFGSENSQCCIC